MPSSEPQEQLDFFAPVVKEVNLHDQQELMMFPFFSLSKRRTKPIVYQTKNTKVEVIPSAKYGMATIWDYDLLLYAASHIINARNRGEKASRTIRSVPYNMLKFIRRGTSGRDYEELKDALARLKGTTIITNIRGNKRHRERGFSWIDNYQYIEDEESGKLLAVEMVLNEWFYEGIADNKLILTMSPEYFELKSGIQRWLYRIARKHGGKQNHGWKFKLRHLHEKSGSSQRFSDFYRDFKRIIPRDIPDYFLFLNEENGEPVLNIQNRANISEVFHILQNNTESLVATNFRLPHV